jgi:hypothetical protein
MKAFLTPMDSGFEAAIDDTDPPAGSTVPYRSIIGALLHIARMTRPDILYAVAILSKQLSAPARCQACGLLSVSYS